MGVYSAGGLANKSLSNIVLSLGGVLFTVVSLYSKEQFLPFLILMEIVIFNRSNRKWFLFTFNYTKAFLAINKWIKLFFLPKQLR